MAIDQATADYEREQENRTVTQDDWAEWSECETSPPTSQPLPPVCAQCVNWQPERPLHLADGTIFHRPGFCETRAAADLSQMSQDYAQRCRLFKPTVPF
ncbi:MAG: hypothetical protein DCF25_11900 [Leptolyngbya foveolarum]|uniref:Uncharacterized protein n=1 Tax=Leptolyngbya foveolarum TaxID=47253 RepID=A0A2W4VX37_9CYAN|nr:MAG: hypothetical protein DCF25_11900 [Leptolyngbya foveolarum]